MKRLVCGTTGFIGFYLGKRVFQRSDELISLAKSYDYHRYRFIKGNLGKLNSRPSTPSIRSGIEAFVPRYREFYGIK